MKSRFLCMIAFLLIAGTVSAQQQYSVNAHAYDNNMPIVATVTIDNQAPASGELVAFVGSDAVARGLAVAQTNLNGTYWIQVYYSTETEAGADVTFKFLNGTDETTLTSAETITIDPEGAGTLLAPIALTGVTTITQTASLAEGWTWWSTPIEMNGNNGLEQLENSISQYGVTIKSKTASVVKRGNTWQGNLSALTNEQMFKINVSSVSSSTITGTVANPSNHVITINPGWNWIGYPVNVSQVVSSALSGFQPVAGDVIKNLGGSAMYRGNQWVQPSYTLTPGSGYMYYSNASVSKELVFSVNRSEEVLPLNNELFWSANSSKYENNMVLVAVVLEGEEEQRDESLELGAFVDGVCVGSSKLFYLEEEDRYYVIMTIGGNENDRITFGLVNKSKGASYVECDNTLFFSNDAIIGDFDNPYKVCFNTLGIGETAMQVAMYPNPVDRGQSFNLNLPHDEEVLNVTIIDALGAVIRHETGALKSAINGLPVTGIYTVKVVCRSGNTYYGRLVVK